MQFNEFRNRMKQANTSTNFINWKQKGKILFVVHPKSEIGERTMIRYERIVTNDEGKNDIWGCRRFYTGDNDISSKFLEWLRDADHIDVDDVVLRLSAGKKVREFLKGDLLGYDDYDWKNKMLNPKSEFMLCAVDLDEVDKGWQVIPLTWGTGNKWWRCVESQIEEYGDEEGDPFVNPYVFKITFDAKAAAANMYMVERTTHKLPPEVIELFKKDPIDIKSICDPSNEDTSQGGTAEELLRAMLVVPCPLFSNKVVEQKAPVEEKEVANEKVDVPESNPCPFVVGTTYVYDDERVVFKAVKNGNYIFVDEEGLKVKVSEAEADEVEFCNDVDSDSEPVEQDDSPVGLKVKDCKKGLNYYDSNGEVLEFVRYNNSKNKGVFKNTSGDRVQMDGDEYIGYGDGADADDPLAPIEDPKADSGEDTCGVCGATLPAGAKSCSECGAVFDADEDDLPKWK